MYKTCEEVDIYGNLKITKQLDILNSLTEEEKENIKKWSQSASIYSLESTLEKFKNIVRDSTVLGKNIQYIDYLDNKKIKVVTIPKDIHALDLRHLYMIARSNAIFEAGSKDSIKELEMLLVMETCISITTYAIQYSKKVVLNPHAKTILINQSGIDFSKSAQYCFLQCNSDEQIIANNGEKVSKNKYKDFIKKQFDLARKASIFQQSNLEQNESLDFRFLRSGLGIFVGSFGKKLDVPRLEAIKEYLQEKLNDEQFDWSVIGSISLPFEDISIKGVQEQIKQIKEIFQEKQIKIFFDEQDCLNPRESGDEKRKYISATTDTCNPLWRFAGGGVFGSINSNALGIHRDVFLNPNILVNGEKLEPLERDEYQAQNHKHNDNQAEVLDGIIANSTTPLNQHKKQHNSRTIIAACISGGVLSIATGFLVEKPLKNVMNNKALLYLSIATIVFVVFIIGGFGAKFLIDKVSECNSSGIDKKK